MSVYKAIGRIVDYAIAYLDIVPDTAASNEDVAAVRQMIDAYNALAPDWDSAPDWAQWYTAFNNGRGVFWELEPEILILRGGWAWMEKEKTVGQTQYIAAPPMPPGIDDRMCKWHRPEVQS